MSDELYFYGWLGDLLGPRLFDDQHVEYGPRTIGIEFNGCSIAYDPVTKRRIITIETNQAGTVYWSSIANKPTTLAGYGITDGADTSHAATHLTGASDAIPLRTPSTDGLMPHNLSIDDLLPAFSIASFAPSGTNYASVVEVGTTLSSLVASATYVSGPPTAPTTITDSLSGTWAFTTPFASASRSGTIQRTGNNESCTFTLSATGPAGVKTSSTTVYWQPLVFHGSRAIGTYNAAFITGLATSNLQSSRACTFTDVIGSGEYDYYAAPSSYGTPTFQYGVLEGGWILVASGVSVTSNGITQNYDIWRSVNAALGSTTWTVT
jgi:hypothetical protein